MRRNSSTTAVLVLLLAASTRIAVAQEPAHDHGDMEMMGDSIGAGKHLALTPHWPEQPGDRARADSVARIAREALAQYADVSVAERDGYRMFAPEMKHQRVYHYSKRANAIKARWTFDPKAPSALLYQPQPNGERRLIGAMYTAPADLSLDDLNQRLPLSIAQWHQHTSICLPPGGLGTRLPGGPNPQFGPRGSITTKSECTAAGGEFKARMFAWMVHVNFNEAPERVLPLHGHGRARD